MRCVDTWNRHIPGNKLSAYKKLIDEKLITDIHVTYYRKQKTTVIEYSSSKPHEWILDQLRERSKREG